MDASALRGPVRLAGTVAASGAKNAALPALAAALLTPERVSLASVPDVADVRTMGLLLAGAGVAIDPSGPGGTWSVPARTGSPRPRPRTTSSGRCAPRSSSSGRFLPASARRGFPCRAIRAIGVRPVNLHLAAIEAMGARIAVEKGYIHAHVSRVGRARAPRSAPDPLPAPTVTGTENVMLAATLARGRTVIENAAREPEVVDLALLLSDGRAHRGRRYCHDHGRGRRVEALDGTGRRRTPILPDRIEAGTYLAAGALTGGDVTRPARARRTSPRSSTRSARAGVEVADGGRTCASAAPARSARSTS